MEGVSCSKVFYDKVKEFQAQYTENPKYKDSFTRHVPFGSIALGPLMLELPNFSSRLQEEYRELLDNREQAFLQSLEIAKSEALVYEFDFTVVDALRGLAEVCFLQGEYRSRVLDYKYAGYQAQDQERKLARLRLKKQQEAEENGELDDGLLKQELEQEEDKWEARKAAKETLEVANYRIKANKYLQVAVATAHAQLDFRDKQHELSATQISDASKIPREVVSELYEASQVSKVTTSK